MTKNGLIDSICKPLDPTPLAGRFGRPTVNADVP